MTTADDVIDLGAAAEIAKAKLGAAQAFLNAVTAPGGAIKLAQVRPGQWFSKDKDGPRHYIRLDQRSPRLRDDTRNVVWYCHVPTGVIGPEGPDMTVYVAETAR